MAYLASGKADVLSGRHFNVFTDPEQMVASANDIVETLPVRIALTETNPRRLSDCRTTFGGSSAAGAAGSPSHVAASYPSAQGYSAYFMRFGLAAVMRPLPVTALLDT